MATRRSRLQIKPNILGGPKGPSTKPAPKTSGKGSNNEGSSTTKSDTSNKVKSPTRLTSPRRNIIVNPLRETSAEKVKNDKNFENEIGSSDKNENISVSENNVEKLVDGESSEPTDKTEIPELPIRGRLRKFGKVNISAARGVKPDSLPSKIDEQESSAEKLKSDSLKAIDVPKKDDSTIEKKTSDIGSSQSSANTTVQRRSRFPKAKPNIVDASRRKQKENSFKEDKVNSSTVDESSLIVPEITVTDTLTNEDESGPRNIKQDIRQASDSAQSMTKIQPRLSATPTPVSKSPLKHPAPTIPLSPEKRARTVSMSEPQVVKRQRKPKVDAPTDKPPDRATMKIKDLIRWNPTNNPMKPKIKNADMVLSAVEKENIGKKEVVGGRDIEDEVAPGAVDTALPVPQVTIGPDGNIVINEKSLIVKNKEHEKTESQEEEVIDETDMYTTYGSFRKRNMSKRWSKKDTKKFYRALAMIGIDFFLISQLFPDRTRFEIKKKFKKEEKVNRALVEKVLKERIRFDPAVFDSQEKEEDSSDEEDDRQKIKGEGKRGRKKNEGKKTENKSKGQQKEAIKKAVKRKKMPLNYFEDDTSEEEGKEPVQKKSNRLDGPWQPQSVSQKDGEVVGILMDMSEGRITSEGQGQENVVNDMDIAAGDDSDKLIAVPVSRVGKGGSFIPLEPKNITMSTNSEAQFSSSKREYSRTVRNIPAIPGIQSISILGSQQISEQGREAGSSTMEMSVQNQAVKPNVGVPVVKQNVSSNAKGQIILPVFNKTKSAIPPTNIQQNVNLYNPQVQCNQSSIPNNEAVVAAGTSQNQIQQYNSVPVSNNQDETDQYVLVTMMPEGGGETVIHIYRLHGGAQSQNQILYADPFASPQMTLDNTSINNSVLQQQSLTGLQTLASNEIQGALTSSETPLDHTLTRMAQSNIHEITGEDVTQSNIQGTAGVCGSSSVSTSVTISDNVVPELKDDIPVQLSYEPVCSDLTSQSSFTQLISNDSTCGDDSKSNLTLTSENSKPEGYISNQVSGEYRSELEYEVENC